jgi:hypothetical protein
MTWTVRRTVPAALAGIAALGLAAVTLGPAVAGSLDDVFGGAPATAGLYPDPPTPQVEVGTVTPDVAGSCVVTVTWNPVGGMVNHFKYAVTEAEPGDTSSDSWISQESTTTASSIDVTVGAGATRWVTVTAEDAGGRRSGSPSVAATC